MFATHGDDRPFDRPFDMLRATGCRIEVRHDDDEVEKWIIKNLLTAVLKAVIKVPIF